MPIYTFFISFGALLNPLKVYTIGEALRKRLGTSSQGECLGLVLVCTLCALGLESDQAKIKYLLLFEFGSC